MIIIILLIIMLMTCNNKIKESYTIYPENETLIENSLLSMYPIGMVIVNTTGNNPNTIKGLEDTEWELVSDDSQTLIVSKKSTKSSGSGSSSSSGTFSTSLDLETEQTELTEYDIPPHYHKVDVASDDWRHKHTVTGYKTTYLSSVNSDDEGVGYFSDDGGTAKLNKAYAHTHDATVAAFPVEQSSSPVHKHKVRIPHLSIYMWRRIA